MTLYPIKAPSTLKLNDVIVTDENFTPDSTNYSIFCDASNNSVTINLPPAVGVKGRIYAIKAIDITNAINIDADGSELIDALQVVPLSSVGDTEIIQSDGANWKRF